MQLKNTDKTVLISGASRGIGEQLALAYAKKGVNLILLARDENNLATVAQSCREMNAQVITHSIDISEADTLKEFIVAIDKQMPIDLAIANAGVSSTLNKNWQPENKSQSDEVFRINLQGTLNTITPVIDCMIDRKQGQIAIMSSLAGLRGLPQSPSYCASKAALYVYAQSLHAWLWRYDIRVSVICPGYVKTAMSEKLIGPKPLLLSSKKAALLIKQGLDKNKFCIAFPRSLYLITKFANYLPATLIDSFLSRYESYIEN
ncbi:SDR family NAD(P)-dependent oxidoreductase [Legionella cardiaca]|uniref:SDR family NAD(P)-dependent oxidoreductase n=1 Tax=Legionella cardiaca TaxID=1071983 RepID=A0ABY8AQK1_9GAMM|nr:SDR family NAD(P)-dependent oxidoreductase [Legionella cardiaca]WED42818.1 SDR family NAD(P)-dependent oxidoreductase [Legionella cardiaca]